MTARTLWLSGGTGLLGGRLVPQLVAGGWTVRKLSRRARPPSAGVETLAWDGLRVDAESLRGTTAAVHLAGEPIFGGLPTAARRARLLASRIDSTRALVGAIEALPEAERPRVLVCASAIGYYGERGDLELREDAAPGRGFLADLCVAWEAEAARVEALGVRRVSLRFGIVLAREGGALALMAPAFRLGLGGRLGSGEQWFSWIHVDDAVGLLRHAVENEAFSGAVNATAPEPVRNREYTRSLGETLGRPAVMAVPAFAVKAALGPLAGELLGSKRVVPAAAERAGFRFRHPTLASALAAELER